MYIKYSDAISRQRNLGVQLTLFQPRGADYAHHITDCPTGFENLKASLYVLDKSKQGDLFISESVNY